MILPSGSSTTNYSKLANSRGWGAGWPACAAIKGGAVRQIRASRSGSSIAGGVHANIQELCTLILNEIERRGYLLHSGWNWGAECRAISGTNTPSNHSWGLAMDLNAPNNPYTSSGQHDIPEWAYAIFRSYGFGCGADYSGKQDWMHVEFMGTPGDAAIMTGLARKNIGGGAIVTPTPTPEDDSMSAAEVAQLSQQIAALNKKVDLIIKPDNQFPGHDIQAEVQYATKAQVLPAVQTVLDRILPPGGRWDNLQDITARINLILAEMHIPVPEGPVPSKPAPTETYTVQPGDTLSGIAKSKGFTQEQLQQWNNIADPNSINVGQVLRLGP